VCYTETPVRVAEGKGAGFSDRLNQKTPVEGLSAAFILQARYLTEV
jgi:hypothetical protein